MSCDGINRSIADEFSDVLDVLSSRIQKQVPIQTVFAVQAEKRRQKMV